jgi:hypothetical protein
MTKRRGGLGASDYESSGGGGGGAPTDAQYWVGAPNGSLSAEHDLSALATGLVKNTGGVPSIAVAGTDYAAASALSLTSRQVAYGTGTGITSASNFVFNVSNQLGVNAAAPTETLTVGGAGYFTGTLTAASATMGAYIDVFAGNARVSALAGSARRTLVLNANELYFQPGVTVGANVVVFRGSGRVGTNDASIDFNPYGATGISSGEGHLVDFNLATGGNVQFTAGAKPTVRTIRVSQPKISFTSASTVTNAATFAIENAPLAFTNCTITNAWALWLQAGAFWVDSGKARFDGDGTHVFELPADATGNVTAATGRVPILVGGATKYLRYFDD